MVPRSRGELGIFVIFVYFLTQQQRLRPLDYCAPHKVAIIIWRQFSPNPENSFSAREIFSPPSLASLTC